MFRSLLSYIFVREFLVQDVLYLQKNDHLTSLSVVCLPLKRWVFRPFFPVQRIDKEGRDAPDFSSGEVRDTTRRLHLPSPLGYLGGCWGWWWVREHVGVELGFRAESFRILRTLYSAGH